MTDCVVLSKAAMLVDGATPGCLLDFWCQRINSDIADAIAAGEAPPPHTGSHQMAETLLVRDSPYSCPCFRNTLSL